MLLFLNGFICCTRKTQSPAVIDLLHSRGWPAILGNEFWELAREVNNCECFLIFRHLSTPLIRPGKGRKCCTSHFPMNRSVFSLPPFLSLHLPFFLCLFSLSFFSSSTLSISMHFLPCLLSLSLQMLPSLPTRIFSSCLMSLSSQAEPNARPSHPTRWGV